jgi:capsular exopolysaccharide synthesis family protein
MSIYVDLLKKSEFQTESKQKVVNRIDTDLETKNRSQFQTPSKVETEQLTSAEIDFPSIKDSWERVIAGSAATSEKVRRVPQLPEDITFQDGAGEGLDFLPVSDHSGLNSAIKQPLPTVEKKPASKQNPIVSIPISKLREKGMVTLDMKNRGIIEEFRHLKRNLLKNIIKSEKSMGVGVVVSSAWPGEGKTFTALNLIMSLSMEKTKKILFVDADLEKGEATKFLDLQNYRGLTDYLEDPSLDANDVTLQTSIESLKIIPRGLTTAHSAEVFSSQRMEAFVKEICQKGLYEMVIFDSPPVLVSSSANILSGMADQTLVVIQANETTGKSIREMEEKLVDSSSIGYVLNRASFSEKKQNSYYA